MIDQSLRRTDELLSELVDLVETARTLPMSTSCVLPRERVLDLLDELRETMPPEIDQARRTLAARDTMLHDAHAQAVATRDRAAEDAERALGEARRQAEETLAAARAHAHEVGEQARAEQARLVAATAVHQSAAAAAAALRTEAADYHRAVHGEADRFAADTRAAAERYAQRVRGEADDYAAQLVGDAEAYTDGTLAELAQTLHRAAATADQGRAALAQRQARRAPEAAAPISG